MFRFLLTPLLAITATAALADPPEKLSVAHLPNAYRLHDKVISGGLPDGEPAFRELVALGVKTIISVDGAKPAVELANKYGLRYVHLPHGYDGIPTERASELAKAVHDLPGPIYIHCHHGKHRSPAAAAVACIAAGLIDPAAAETILTTAGTGPNYRGLYQSAHNARPLSEENLAKIKSDFPEKAAIPPLAEAMVAIEHRHDLLKQIAANNWSAPSDHPAIDPAHEALLLREDFEELLRVPQMQAKPAAFQEFLRDSHSAAKELENALQAKSPAFHAAAALGRITNNCTACHQQFRDIPLSQKTN
jgi:protein tyrosine phosphatase (PTP) superfamily phosphohydrolase (DUF442 family)